MISTVCPACNRKGNIPENKVNTRLHCKKCDAVFHVNPAGIALLGEPDTAEARARKQARAAHEAAKADPIEEAAERVKRLPKAVRYGGGLGAVTLAAVLMLPAFGFRVIPAPETSEEAAVRAARALLLGDSETLRRLATPETATDVPSWLTRRPALFPGLPDGTEPKAVIDAKLAALQPKGPTVRTEVSVVVLADATTKTPQIFVSFPVDMAKVGRSWKVDVSTTQSLSPIIPPDAASKHRR